MEWPDRGAMSNENDNPEWTDADFARARPFRKAFPEQHEAWKRRGRPPVATLHIGFRLAADVVREALAEGRL
jgi:uncharacterized protein (DUF4415 family)